MRNSTINLSNHNFRRLPHPPGIHWRKQVALRCADVPVIKPIIVDTICHDAEAFTQGLIYHQGYLYESTGLYRKSSLRKIAPSGEILANKPVTEGFAEGLAFHNNELVQLTWNERLALRYSLPDLKKIGYFKYRGQGWGLTSDSKIFIMSNGSANLYLRDNQFAVVGKLNVTLEGNPVYWLNDLEYLNNKIYANVWCCDFLLEIDYNTGQVSRIIDCCEILCLEAPNAREKVLNGIAYCNELESFYLTGKQWHYYYLVKIPPPI